MSAEAAGREPSPPARQATVAVCLLGPATRLATAALLVVSRGTLCLLALYHLPLLFPLLYHLVEYRPLSPPELERLLLTLFVVPEAAARLLRRRYAAQVSIDGGALVLGDRRVSVALGDIAAVRPWAVPLPGPGLHIDARAGRRDLPGVALADPTALLSLLADAGLAERARTAAESLPVRFAAARARARSLFDQPLLKFVLYPLVPALPLFRLRQIVAYGGVLGEYQMFGLWTYLLGFAVYWLLAAVYLLLYATALRLVAETVAAGATWLLPGREFGVRRAAEVLTRAAYYLGPPVLMVVELVLRQ